MFTLTDGVDAVPSGVHILVFKIAHNTNLGQFRTYKSLRCRYWWPQLQGDTYSVSIDCEVCKKFNTKAPKDPPVIF